MSDTLKNRFIGVVTTIITVIITFLGSQYFFSFQTKAESEKAINIVKGEIKKELNQIKLNQRNIICYLDKTKCL